jgi:hypothetical protein
VTTPSTLGQIAVQIGNADFNAVIEDQRNIVVIDEQSPNTVIVTVPGVNQSMRAGVVYGSGVPWDIEVEI